MPETVTGQSAVANQRTCHFGLQQCLPSPAEVRKQIKSYLLLAGKFLQVAS